MKRPLLLPLVPLYGAGLWVKRHFAGEVKQLAHPVVSVGSLSAGGAGKTPVVAALSALLMRHGYTVDILSRGYGRASKMVGRVDPAGTAAQFGDEPLLLAQAGATVYVGADRYAAGLLAERDAAAGVPLVHLLDDGFQHRRLGRDLDIVLLTLEDVRDLLLPAGNLREPLSRLRGAGAVVVREEEAGVLRPRIAQIAGNAMPVWTIRRRLSLQATKAPGHLLAFCGIARPESFFSMLRANSTSLAGTVAFRDHEIYRYRQIQALLNAASQRGATGFITTDKDAVKLLRPMWTQLEALGPVSVARLTVEFLEEDAMLQQIRTLPNAPTP